MLNTLVLEKSDTVGLYLSPKEKIPTPKNLPHIIFRWPRIYNWGLEDYIF